mmetsp:Transcript_6236/g.14119  ORF Transcript_6236/g.14119 Transcript_6236/m.14119 type:complete len:95 (+) Transcript_6236:3455-3739(+)
MVITYCIVTSNYYIIIITTASRDTRIAYTTWLPNDADDLANDSDGIGVKVGDVVGLELVVGTGENVGANDHGDSRHKGLVSCLLKHSHCGGESE